MLADTPQHLLEDFEPFGVPGLDRGGFDVELVVVLHQTATAMTRDMEGRGKRVVSSLYMSIKDMCSVT